jgi:2-epi-5-epi-valiolone synthase
MAYKADSSIVLHRPWSFRSFLRSLDQRNISNGAAEMLKMACIKDEELFLLLEEHAEDMMVSKFQVRPPT